MYSGTGFYSLAEAARLVRVPTKAITRWLYGYSYTTIDKDHEKQQHFSAPLWKTEYATDAFADKVIGFRDLLELRVVREFVGHGLPLLVVRRCLETARQVYGDYPMTTHKFCTDGKTVFMRVMRDGLEKELLDLRKRQLVFSDIIKPSLYSGIEYEGDTARRWYPEGKSRRNIVLDPLQQFGKPVVAEIGVPTEALFSNFKVEGADQAALNIVARIFDIPVRKVQAAVQFEEQLRLAA
ncbi:MAG: DUF433 domain-containing protein [Rhodoferax sp.]|nr:DUF433 domain-containing protein [Rhodoferax sp.]